MFQAGKVALHLFLCFKGGKHCVQDFARVGIFGSLYSIVHPLALAPGLYDSGTAKISEMP